MWREHELVEIYLWFPRSDTFFRTFRERDKFRAKLRPEAIGNKLGEGRRWCKFNGLFTASQLIIFRSRACNQNVFRLMFLTPVGFSGWTMMALLVIIWTFSTRQMREYFYNSFLGVHHLFLVFFIMMYYHPVRYLCVPPTMLRSLFRLFYLAIS